MTAIKKQLEEALRQAKPRSLESALFNIANAFNESSMASWQRLTVTMNADHAAPAIVCQAFSIELLLKFFLAIDHPKAKSMDELKSMGIKLSHRYSDLFDQLSEASKGSIAAEYARLTSTTLDSAGFREQLISQGNEPFVYWRYVYERSGESHFDKKRFDAVTDAVGLAAQAARRAAANGD